MIEDLSKRLDFARSYVVEKEEKAIEFGKFAEWNDVEGDEADLGKLDTG